MVPPQVSFHQAYPNPFMGSPVMYAAYNQAMTALQQQSWAVQGPGATHTVAPQPSTQLLLERVDAPCVTAAT